MIQGNQEYINQHTDIYFLRAVDVLKSVDLNPQVKAQVFFREPAGKIYGVNAVLRFLGETELPLEITYLPEGVPYKPGVPVMYLTGAAQDLIPLETILLGELSYRTTDVNDGVTPTHRGIMGRAQNLVEAAEGRPIFYMGARHWRPDDDRMIAEIVQHAGFAGASTRAAHPDPIGTIPHSLQCVFAWKYGMHAAVSETFRAFKAVFEGRGIPLTSLVDFNNREIEDSLNSAQLGAEWLRIDTCGENCMQGTPCPGVSVPGVSAVRDYLEAAGFRDRPKIMLSSGFGDPDKIRKFNPLADAYGVGRLFACRTATMDIVEIEGQPMSKVGRKLVPLQNSMRYEKKVFSNG